MSWFTEEVEHPALNALAALLLHPAVANNPELQAVVQQAQTDATNIAATTTTAAQTISSQIQADVDPIVSGLNQGIITALDAALVAYLGPVGTALTPAANMGLALLEEKAHNLIASLFHQVKATAPAVSA